jgi:hypothetical protein
LSENDAKSSNGKILKFSWEGLAKGKREKGSESNNLREVRQAQSGKGQYKIKKRISQAEPEKEAEVTSNA